MTHRIFRVNGKVVDRIDTYAEGRHISPDAAACAEVASALGVAVDAVAVEHVEEIPPVAVVIPPAPPAPLPEVHTTSAAEASALPQIQHPKLEAVRTILAKQDADITPAEVRTLVLVMARYFFKKWLDGWR